MRYFTRFSALFALFTAGASLNALASATQVPQVPQAQFEANGIEIQARGIMHEAFARPIGTDIPQPSPFVPKAPPPPIPEDPAEFQPEGNNIQWIGGYWAWDADTNDYIWISGGYRNIPPGQRYVAGYWEQTAEGWRWVSGFWAPVAQTELPYLPEPPAPLEIGPTFPPPGENFFYSPGAWAFRQSRYVWQPGYYAPFQPGFVWVPPNYAWTPNGYLCLPGFWDFPINDCGLLFAPVAFRQPFWNMPGWRWRPNFALSFSALCDNFFIDVSFGRYRFGDYYGRNFFNRGIHPWHVRGPQQFDSQFNYLRWQNRNNPNWMAGLNQRFDDRFEGRQPLPPRTLAQQNLLANQNVKGPRLVQSVTDFNDNGPKLARVSAEAFDRQKLNAKQFNEASQLRLQSETAFAKGKGKATGPATLQLDSVAKGIGGTAGKAPRSTINPDFTIPGGNKGASNVTSPKTLQTLPPGKKGTADFSPPKTFEPLNLPGKKGVGDTASPKTTQNIIPPGPPKTGQNFTTPKTIQTIPPGPPKGSSFTPPNPPKSIQSNPPGKKGGEPMPINSAKNFTAPPGVQKSVQNFPPANITQSPPKAVQNFTPPKSPPTQKQFVQQQQPPTVTIPKSPAQNFKAAPPPQQTFQQAKPAAPKPMVSSSPKSAPMMKSQSPPTVRSSPPPAARSAPPKASSRPPANSGGNRGGGGGKGKK